MVGKGWKWRCGWKGPLSLDISPLGVPPFRCPFLPPFTRYCLCSHMLFFNNDSPIDIESPFPLIPYVNAPVVTQPPQLSSEHRFFCCCWVTKWSVPLTGWSSVVETQQSVNPHPHPQGGKRSLGVFSAYYWPWPVKSFKLDGSSCLRKSCIIIYGWRAETGRVNQKVAVIDTEGTFPMDSGSGKYNWRLRISFSVSSYCKNR